MNVQLNQVLASSTADKKLAASRRMQVPSIRFEVPLEKPTSETFSEFNFNRLVLKTLKTFKRKAKRAAKSGNTNESGGAAGLVALGKKDCEKLETNYELVMNKYNKNLYFTPY